MMFFVFILKSVCYVDISVYLHNMRIVHYSVSQYKQKHLLKDLIVGTVSWCETDNICSF